ncbi:unnamed protein product [Soboliphyme baturini]|uniref:Serine/threonine-protein phosphatase n=1 Tax=Soboliphyme baturini TaxID=241478 RepID=A0A183IDT7_9BILA|nr:unnamed protein product [Soboliphyme baturini]
MNESYLNVKRNCAKGGKERKSRHFKKNGTEKEARKNDFEEDPHGGTNLELGKQAVDMANGQTEIEGEANQESRLRQLVIKLHTPRRKGFLTESEIRYILKRAIRILKNEPTMLELEAPIVICGDVHGQYNDLIRMFQYGGWPPEKQYLFLGDYVDRGPQSIETICHLLLYKVMFPKRISLLRGNHECRPVNVVYGFMQECKNRYSVELFDRFQEVFSWLPICALVSQKLLCMHGGISPHLASLDQIKAIGRPLDVPRSGLICDLLWSDPDPEISGWKPSHRGASYLFGSDTVLQCCNRLKIDLVVRAHQVVPKGFEFFAQNHLVTIFSAPNYCNEFDNAGAIMLIDEHLRCRILVCFTE